MGVPKSKTSKSQTRIKRNARWKREKVQTTVCANCGADKLPHVVCPECGSKENKKKK